MDKILLTEEKETLLIPLQEDEIKALISNLRNWIGSYTLIFDAFSVFTAKKVKNHPSIKKTNATIHWGIDDPKELENWGMGARLIEEQYFTSNKEIENLDTGTRIMFKIADAFPIAKKAQRLLIYRVD